jgi:hypothetical protein
MRRGGGDAQFLTGVLTGARADELDIVIDDK